MGCGKPTQEQKVGNIEQNEVIETETEASLNNENFNTKVDSEEQKESKEEENGMEELIQKFSGTWVNEEENITVEIKVNGKGFWSLYYTTEKNGTEVFAIKDIVDAKEQSVIPMYSDCDYLFKMGSGEFSVEAGVKLFDDSEISLKWTEGDEHRFCRG